LCGFLAVNSAHGVSYAAVATNGKNTRPYLFANGVTIFVEASMTEPFVGDFGLSFNVISQELL
jgi:hypothetical protein